jgi:outer membrane protein TolC
VQNAGRIGRDQSHGLTLIVKIALHKIKNMLLDAWMRMVGRVGLIPLLLLEYAGAYAQEPPVRLTAEQAVSAALAGNRQVKMADWDQKIAASRYKETEALFLPHAEVAYTAMTTNDPLSAFGFKLQQRSITAADFNPDQLNHPNGTSDFMTSAEVQQPLLNLDQLYQRRAAAMETAVYRSTYQRTQEAVIFEVQKAYMQLQLAGESVKVLEESLKSANALLHYTADRVDQGMLSQSDALNVRVQVTTTETRLAEARSQVKNASDYLSLLMGMPLGAVYAVDSSDYRQPDTTPDSPGSTLADKGVPAGRADLEALQKAIAATDLGIRSQKMSAFPRLNAFGSYQFNDSRMLGFGAGAYLGGIRLSWDIFKGNSIRNKVVTLTLQRNKLAEQLSLRSAQSDLELNTARRRLADAGYKIRQQRSAVESAAESFRILKDRYEQGLAGSTDVLLAQTQLSQQRLALAQAIFDDHVAVAYIQFLTTSAGN